ncbi:TetR/AcrR family transcriptional regulator [Kitasatospora sp. NPDC059722]|uniref:TetR/AcrR family transcriptional regulator n=1 Tax=Kitasatospora sp. NPDC059722 TaxID=3346925 RepID=UPI0036BDF640
MPDIKHFDPDAALATVERLFWERGLAATGIQDIVTATGLSRSSLYATFGGKRELYLAALRRYRERRSLPMIDRLAEDGRGLAAVADYFTRLIATRCSGEHARRGCMVVNAHAGTENGDPDVREILDRHHGQLREALHGALLDAREAGELAPGVDPAASADLLVLLAYGVNLRSRAGADAESLGATVAATLTTLGGRAGG